MVVYLKRRNSPISAIGDYDIKTGALTVKKGSIVSDSIAHTEKFRGAHAIEKYRKEYVKDGITIDNVEFKSASTAANFVTGSSTNGLIAWKNESGVTLKTIISELAK